MAFDPISAVLDVGKTAINKIFRDKASESEVMQLEQNFELELLREAHKNTSSFREFILEYEGAAKDSPRLIRYFRAIIRPTFTCLVGYLDWVYFTVASSTWEPDKIALLKAINIIVLLFWFGERAVKNSGVIELLKGKMTKG